MAADNTLFRAIFATLPTAVAVVTALDRDGTPRGFTCNAVTAVSADPPLLLVCVDRTSVTSAALRTAGAFVVNFLAADAAGTSRRFAGKGEDKFDGVATTPSRAAGGAPVLTGDAVAVAECVTTDVVPAGDHWIVLGRVEAGSVHERDTLMYFRRTYSAWAATPAPVG